ncbi:unconventional prefoldin RPB5 interactor isoform a [Mus musculus]|uniref:Unconventional prefoldin RPB5 interactor n=1 Tax=Mus musculus TaxID=10090 RepID=RMP_MOUSE|nr:unconventional prefoldin RPB5 interactor isoform a [Mus musculus]Q3TLD5.2 RecName: Full=Unconventional prefoldin RPB5 interactor; AltName: Full=Protein NNX3; AltName: Full=Protein phosphatase 1 regulatory subunit 19; AltName: Full=RNA polymerase II subunit 5-mediating protein; Short=RPB5-mediating protein [Mus musculus]EDL02994.1 expressed sequence C80913 [Mus musculus]|eukprot:NP_035404.4 unconventional prefoldin RPB5 interactor [Mus musculus]
MEPPSEPEPEPQPLAEASAAAPLRAPEVARLREEQEKVVTNCQEKIQHWEKVDNDYSALQERLRTLPDKLSYDVMVPFGPLAFMPGKLVHTNEVTVLLGDNWFAKCSAKQAVGLVEHRKEHVRKTIDDFKKVLKNFESRVEFTEDLQKMSDAAGDFVDIREEIKSDFEFKGKQRIAHKPHSKPKTSDIFEADFENGVKPKNTFDADELWARLEELERQEELLGELESKPDTVIANGEDRVSSEEEKEGADTGVNVVSPVTDSSAASSCKRRAGNAGLPNGQVNSLNYSVNGSNSYHSNKDDDEEEEDDDDDDDEDDDNESDHAISADNSIPTIYFSHTVEPKRVRINTGKNTTLKFSEKKEEAKRKRKSGAGSHATHELPAIKSPADIYRVFVDVVNGEYVPRKSILKSRSRENSVCSDTSESSAADVEDRRGLLRSTSSEEAVATEAGGSSLDELQENHPKKPLPSGVSEAFSGTVIEKEFLSPSLAPYSAIAHHALPTIPERKEVPSEVSEEPTKRVSKFRAARLQQRS